MDFSDFIFIFDIKHPQPCFAIKENDFTITRCHFGAVSWVINYVLLEVNMINYVVLFLTSV